MAELRTGRARSHGRAERTSGQRDPDDAAITYGIACLHGQFGNVDLALDYLEQAIEAGFGHKDWIENDPDLNTVHRHPRFAQVLSKINQA